MEATFVSQPVALLPARRQPRLCRRAQSRVWLVPFSRQAVKMSSSESNGEAQSLKKTSTGNSQQLLGDTDLIVDVGDEDISDEDISDILGLEEQLKTEKRKPVRRKTSQFYDEIDQEPNTIFTDDADMQPPIDDDETTQFVRTVVRAADDRKAEDVVALRISKLSYIASFIVIITGGNIPQVRAIGNLVEEELAKKHEMYAKRKDGTANSGWLLLDYGDFLVNIFLPEQRELYNLEKLWKHGEVLDVSDCLSGPAGEAGQRVGSADSLDDWLDE